MTQCLAPKKNVEGGWQLEEKAHGLSETFIPQSPGVGGSVKRRETDVTGAVR